MSIRNDAARSELSLVRSLAAPSEVKIETYHGDIGRLLLKLLLLLFAVALVCVVAVEVLAGAVFFSSCSCSCSCCCCCCCCCGCVAAAVVAVVVVLLLLLLAAAAVLFVVAVVVVGVVVVAVCCCRSKLYETKTCITEVVTAGHSMCGPALSAAQTSDMSLVSVVGSARDVTVISFHCKGHKSRSGFQVATSCLDVSFVIGMIGSWNKIATKVKQFHQQPSMKTQTHPNSPVSPVKSTTSTPQRTQTEIQTHKSLTFIIQRETPSNAHILHIQKT